MKKAFCILMLLASTADAAHIIRKWSSVSGPDPDFKFTWVIANTNAVTIPTRDVDTWNATVDWGDGSSDSTITAWNDADLTHSYAGAGTYQVTVSGSSWPTVYFYGAPAATLITGVDNVGSNGWTTFYRSFRGCTNLKYVKGDSGFGGVASFQEAFYGCTALTNCAATDWDVSGATTLNSSWYGCSSLTTLGDLSGWDVSDVTSLYYAWSGCSSLTTLGDLSGWDVSKATTFLQAWSGCSSLTTLGDLSGWDVSGVTSFSYAWYGCSALTTLGDLSGWDVSGVTSFSYAWYNCSSLTTLGDLSGWDVSDVTTLYSTWYGCSALTNETIRLLPSGLTTARYAWDNADEVPGDVASWTNLASSCTYLGFFNADALTYSASGGCLSSNIAHGINIDWRNATLSSDEADYILCDLDTSGATNGVVNLSGTGNSAPSITGLNCKTNLVDNKGWTVTHN